MRTLLAALAAAALASNAGLSSTPAPAGPSPAAPSPAERAIALARQSNSSLDLARALVRRHRETADPRFLADAEAALRNVFDADAESFEGLKVRVMIHLARHEDAAALALARSLNQRTPDDALVYGLMADACLALGDYAEAEKQAQWMIDLRRAKLGGMLRGAFLREIYGDIEGAAEWFTAAYRLASATETEERAWILSQMARMNFSAGRPDAAARLLAQAETLFPNHPMVLELQTRLLLKSGRGGDALALIARMPAGPARVALAAQATGKYDEFVREAEARIAAPANLNRELALYYAGIANRTADAVRVARAEAARRQDIYTLDALAWSLHKNGQSAEALRTIEKALQTGTRDSSILSHAEAIRKGMQRTD
jgi:tetratricopeptide (TPR) repeat protein